jgi:hypothetical protein
VEHIKRKSLIERLKSWDDKGAPEVGLAIDLLESSESELVSKDEAGDVWERISKAIDHKYSDDEEHDAWKLEKSWPLNINDKILDWKKSVLR